MGKVIIDRERCKGCNLCVTVCSLGVLKKSDIVNSRGYYPVVADQENKCSICLKCALLCPDVAIEIWR